MAVPPASPFVLPPPNTDPVPPFPLPGYVFPGTLPVLLCPVLLLPRPSQLKDDDVVLPAEPLDSLDADDEPSPRPGELFPLEVGLFELIPPDTWFKLDPNDIDDDPKVDELLPLSAGFIEPVPVEPRLDPNDPMFEKIPPVDVGLFTPEPTPARLGLDTDCCKVELNDPAPTDPF